MKTTLIAAALLALAPAAALAAGDPANGQTVAVDTCTAFNAYGPVDVVTTVDDGMGDYLVWIEDVDGDLWACNANAAGDIYANVPVIDDLLGGEGPELIHLVGLPSRLPEKQAERVCLAVADGEAEIVATVADGLGDYLVWLTADYDTFVMCNASADGRLYAFEPVSMPINELPALDPATVDIEETPARPAITSPARPPTQFG